MMSFINQALSADIRSQPPKDYAILQDYLDFIVDEKYPDNVISPSLEHLIAELTQKLMAMEKSGIFATRSLTVYKLLKSFKYAIQIIDTKMNLVYLDRILTGKTEDDLIMLVPANQFLLYNGATGNIRFIQESYGLFLLEYMFKKT